VGTALTIDELYWQQHRFITQGSRWLAWDNVTAFNVRANGQSESAIQLADILVLATNYSMMQLVGDNSARRHSGLPHSPCLGKLLLLLLLWSSRRLQYSDEVAWVLVDRVWCLMSRNSLSDDGQCDFRDNSFLCCVLVDCSGYPVITGDVRPAEPKLNCSMASWTVSGRVTRLYGCIGDRLKRRSCSVFWYSGNLLICYCSRLVLIGPSDADGLFPPLTLISGGVILSYRGTRLPSSVFGPSNSAHSENNLLLLRCSLLPPVTLLLYDVNVNDIIHTICVRGTEELG